MAHKEMIYLEGLAKGMKFYNLLKSINAATILHEGQFRKSGEPYIEHPMRMTSLLTKMGILDDKILSACMLHDVPEDCEITFEELAYHYQIDKNIIDDAYTLKKEKGVPTKIYYSGIKEKIACILIKGIDREDNLSTMINGFTLAKMEEYNQETKDYVIPMLKYGVKYHPEYSDQLYVIKFHIVRMMETVDGFLKMMNSRRNDSEF